MKRYADTVTITKSSGNVWKDLGLPHADERLKITRFKYLENKIDRLEKNLKENYLKKADLWKGIAVGLAWVGLAFLMFVLL